MKRKRTKWTLEDIVKEIIRLNKIGEPLNAYNIMKKYGKLYGAARKHFGDWGSAVEKAGFDYSQINKRKNEVSWTKEKIIAEIEKRKEAGLSLKSDYVQKENTRLHSASQRYFGCWKVACEEAGFDYEKEIKEIRWYPETIVEKIKELVDNDTNLASSDIQESHMDLFQAGCRIFGSWKKSVEAAGLDYSKYRKQKSWDAQMIFDAIDEIQKNEGNIRAGYISQNHGGLYQASRRVFGSWSSAMRAYNNR